jgi:hypothetical protein
MSKAKGSGTKILSGIDGVRFRLRKGQAIPQLKDSDPDHLRPKPVADAYTRVFDMSDDEDLKEYTRVWNEAAKGHIMISAEERHWCDATQNFKIFLRWGDVYLEIPDRDEVYYGR